MTNADDRAVDRTTVVAIAIVAYALANLMHEGLGHGGTCIAVGGRLTALSAVGYGTIHVSVPAQHVNSI
jgi:hypothetical protein